jgi:hypothetical protein
MQDLTNKDVVINENKLNTTVKSCQTLSPLMQEINEKNYTLNKIGNNSLLSSNFETGEEYSDLKSEHHYLNDSITSTVLKKNSDKQTPKGIWRVSM